jgi:bifunctional DNA-binding transcriptional regulator/antitoxin component of YhaV-PrlF toxin-antitoxin module
MLAEMRSKSQMTIPMELAKKFFLSECDKFKVFEKDGMIYMMPVVVYPKAYVEKLKKEVETVKAKMKAGEQPVFSSGDDLFKTLEDK